MYGRFVFIIIINFIIHRSEFFCKLDALIISNNKNEELQAAIEVLNQIKENCINSSSNSEKVLLLTPAPKSWSNHLAKFSA